VIESKKIYNLIGIFLKLLYFIFFRYSNFVSNTLGPSLKPIPSIDTNRNLLEINILPPLNSKKERPNPNILRNSFMSAKMELQMNNQNNFSNSYSGKNGDDDKSQNSQFFNSHNQVISSYVSNVETIKYNYVSLLYIYF
jgi:RNA recognition motif-containing protein